jgi:CRISPR-associated exonuclease Cas4
MDLDQEQSLIPATDLKQWAYCPRIVYFHHVLGLFPPMTYKMNEALSAQSQFERWEARRRLDKYGFADGTREFNLFLTDPSLGLSGKLDLLISSGDKATVVDFKLTPGEPGENHRLQLSAYALLVEKVREVKVDTVFFYRIPDDHLFPIQLTPQLRNDVLAAIERIQNLASGDCPPATAVRGRCQDCEYANFCADVW